VARLAQKLEERRAEDEGSAAAELLAALEKVL
jgi:hypothetical protein